MTTDSNATTISYTPGPYFYQRGSDGCDDTWEIIAQPSQRYVAKNFHFWDDDTGHEGAPHGGQRSAAIRGSDDVRCPQGDHCCV